ncbi:MAG: hypothetical protein A6F72_08540 [Cycloclasticus sp. symbiont of Poecilosclerida sp. N]|nr:MAG: hypothetical protein A6F72_08540 [Cycloclasticus sp. symbiont of Poecilosclerida sp. N]
MALDAYLSISLFLFIASVEKKMKKIFIVLCVLILSSGTAFSSGYISTNLGVAISESSDFTLKSPNIPDFTLAGETSANTDFAASLAAGSYKSDNIRLEAEVNYQHNGIEELEGLRLKTDGQSIKINSQRLESLGTELGIDLRTCSRSNISGVI